MKALRNLPVFLWWIACIWAIINFPVALLVMAMMFLLAAPFKSLIITDVDDVDNVEGEPPLAITKYSVLNDMTRLTTLKALNYGQDEHTDPDIKILDVSPKGRKLT